MERHYSYIYDVKFKNGSYEYVTGNVEFYRFLNEDFFINFDKLITENSKAVLEKAIEKGDHYSPFILEFYHKERETCLMVAAITDDSTSDCTVLRMIDLNNMYDDYYRLIYDKRENIALLSQIDCIYYTYEVETNIITTYNYKEEKEVITASDLKEWRRENESVFSSQALPNLDKFISNLKNGIRNFIGSIPQGSDRGSIDFSGVAIYNNDVHVRTVGIIGKSGIKAIGDAVRRDQLTGLYLKEDITTFAKKMIDDLKQKAAIAIIDIDDFKNVNDQWGHSVGDKVLKKCAAIIADQLRNYGKAGRIGGDEFFIVIEKFEDMQTIRSILRGIKMNIADAYSVKTDGFRVTTSIGLSMAPDDADNFNSLYNLADHMLYLAKNKGKNRYIFYDKAKHGSVEDILQTNVDKIGVVSRRGLGKGEAICQFIDLMYRGKPYTPEDILSAIAKFFAIDRVLLFNKTDKTLMVQRGLILPTDTQKGGNPDYVYDERLDSYFEDNVMVINNVKAFRIQSPQVYESLKSQGVLSIMQHRLKGVKSGKEYVLSYESISANDCWHLDEMYLYRLLDKIMAECL